MPHHSDSLVVELVMPEFPPSIVFQIPVPAWKAGDATPNPLAFMASCSSDLSDPVFGLFRDGRASLGNLLNGFGWSQT
jgi:hypothetical protein